ncbi:4a-hydroxytetrahydrobiopterin dehydratase [Granulicella arctica]|uniref:Putative pterin-4-alpha-carbinolamine dehydratase n=1 Tax=Granulicella arctica TaxID=940613 RepID=A0A7Y9PHF0_9BACT|nr:4a-hydroxytetrahydrobiopterin dehydratase [Granulicella arctica]NYF79942.1 4a-hydroxytetrahydrobiopterin dehydratase [Granulicella arctica]
MAKLSGVEIDAVLAEQPTWRLEGGALVRDWAFKNFVEAMAFVNRVGALAEEVDHHPDIDIRYNKVRLTLISHDVGGITKRDSGMAAKISSAF